MPALNLTFTDEEMAALRLAAANAELSLKAFAHNAVVEAASDRKRRIREAHRRGRGTRSSKPPVQLGRPLRDEDRGSVESIAKGLLRFQL